MTRFFERHAFKILLFVAFLLPFFGMGAKRALRSNKNDVAQWLPAQYPETKVYQKFRQLFSNEQFILVSWQGCYLDDQRLRLLTEKLRPAGLQDTQIEAGAKETESAESPAGNPLFVNAMSGPLAMAQMTAPPLSLPPEEALRRLEGSLVGKDHRQTCLVLTLSELAKRDLKKTVDTVVRVATQECGVPEADLHMGGPPVDNVAIDRAGEKSLVRLAGLSGLIGLTISWLSLRSKRLVAMVLFTGGVSVMASLAAVFFTGTPFNAILLTMPSLVYVSAISGAIHLANYYRETVKHSGPQHAAGHALSHATLPLTLATLTTAIGLATLYTSDLVPIQLFGLYSAIGILLSLLALFILLPAMLETWPLQQSAPSLQRDGGTLFSLPNAVWDRMGRLVTGHPTAVLVGSLVCMLICGWGISRIETSVSLMRMFEPRARLVQDYAWLEQNLGELVPLEMMIKFDTKDCPLTFWERLQFVERMQGEVTSLPEVGSAVSAATFAPLPPQELETDASNPFLTVLGGQRGTLALFGSQLERHRDAFLKGDYLRDLPDAEAWRITARVGALQNTDYGVFVKQLQAKVEPLLDAYRWARQIDATLRNQGGKLAGSRLLVVGTAPASEEAPRTPAELLVDTLVARGAAVDWEEPDLFDPQAQQARRYDLVLQVNAATAVPASRAMPPQHAVAETDVPTLTTLGPALSNVANVNYPLEKESVPSIPIAVGFGDTAELRLNSTLAKTQLDTAEGISASTAEELGVEIVYTGLVPLVYRAQHSLLSGMASGFMLDMVLVAVVMTCLVRSWAAGVVLLISAVFPACVVFGMMGWLGVIVDPGTIMTPAVALGVTVDDVVHFMLWFRQGRKQGLSQRDAVLLGYRSTAQAMYQSWGVIGLGLSVFAVSPFMPTQRFGVMMLTLLSVALVGNLLFLPTLLMGPLGVLFGRLTAADEAQLKEQASLADAQQRGVPHQGTIADGLEVSDALAGLTFVVTPVELPETENPPAVPAPVKQPTESEREPREPAFDAEQDLPIPPRVVPAPHTGRPEGIRINTGGRRWAG